MSEVNGTIIAEGTKIVGNIESEQPVAVAGHVVGNIKSESAVAITGSIEGNISAKSTGLKEEARVKGNITCENKLIVEEGCSVEGNVDGSLIVLHGCVKGDIKAAELEISSAAELVGDITAGSVVIEKGAQLKCSSVVLGQEQNENKNEEKKEEKEEHHYNKKETEGIRNEEEKDG